MANALPIWFRSAVFGLCRHPTLTYEFSIREREHLFVTLPLAITSLANTRTTNSRRFSMKRSHATKSNGFSSESNPTNGGYLRAIHDLNHLQTNNQVIALAKYKQPETILPLFARQLRLAGIDPLKLNDLDIIHVSGTKGKGSTCAFTESILRASGLKTGFYNSPHLVKVTERIKINGLPISEELFSRYFRTIYDRLYEACKVENESMPSYFAFLTILAFHIFLEERVDCAIIEVGIGGNYDPTNIVEKPIACGITTLDFDHTNILGNTLKSIAWSKAGIIKEGAAVFTVDHDKEEVLEVIKSRATAKGCQFFICKPLNTKSQGIHLGIKGKVQQINASVACQLARYFLMRTRPSMRESLPKISHLNNHTIEISHPLPEAFRKGLENCNWPGRCQIIQYPRVKFFLDGAHTKKSMENCLEWFTQTSDESATERIKVLMLNVIGERNKSDVLEPSTKCNDFDLVIFSTNRINSLGETPKSETFVNSKKVAPNNEKSLENAKSNMLIWSDLYKSLHGESFEKPQVKLLPNVSDSLESIIARHKETSSKDMHVLVTGSLHFVGAMLETLPAFSHRLQYL